MAKLHQKYIFPPTSPRHETPLNAESNSSLPQMDQINPARERCLAETRCASNAVIYSKLRLQTDLLLMCVHGWESWESPSARSTTCHCPVPMGCLVAPKGHCCGTTQSPPGHSIQDLIWPRFTLSCTMEVGFGGVLDVF